MRKVSLLHRKVQYRLFVHTIPTKGHTLRLLLDGTADAVVLEIRKVMYDVRENGRTMMVQLQACRRSHLDSSPDGIGYRFWTELEWVSRTCLPCIGDSIRLNGAEAANPADLQVWDVIHDIDQVGRKQTIKVRVVDSSPQRVFSDEVIQGARGEGIEPLCGFDDLAQDGSSNDLSSMVLHATSAARPAEPVTAADNMS